MYELQITTHYNDDVIKTRIHKFTEYEHAVFMKNVFNKARARDLIHDRIKDYSIKIVCQ